VRSQKEFRCVCGAQFGDDRDYAVQHVEQLHVGEFDVRDLDVLEAAIEERIKPSPLK